MNREMLSADRAPNLMEEIERSNTLDDIVQALMYETADRKSALPIRPSDTMHNINCEEAARLVSKLRQWVRDGRPEVAGSDKNPLTAVQENLPQYLVRKIKEVVDVPREESGMYVGMWHHTDIDAKVKKIKDKRKG